MRPYLAICATALLGIIGIAASADNLTLSQGNGLTLTVDLFRPDHPSTGHPDGTYKTYVTYGGSIKASVNNSPAVDTYCVDLTTPLVYNTSAYTRNSTTGLSEPYSKSGVGPRLAWLVDKYSSLTVVAGNAVQTRINSAGLQLAIWETEYDYNSTKTNNNLSLITRTGDTGLTNAFILDAAVDSDGTDRYSAVLSQANVYLTALGSNTSGAIWWRSQTGNQDLIMTPEPGTLSLLGVSLAGMGGLYLRRRKARNIPA